MTRPLSREERRKRFLIGLAALLAVAGLWCASVVAQVWLAARVMEVVR